MCSDIRSTRRRGKETAKAEDMSNAISKTKRTGEKPLRIMGRGEEECGEAELLKYKTKR
jgi:hypothetical protein